MHNRTVGTQLQPPRSHHAIHLYFSTAATCITALVKSSLTTYLSLFRCTILSFGSTTTDCFLAIITFLPRTTTTKDTDTCVTVVGRVLRACMVWDEK